MFSPGTLDALHGRHRDHQIPALEQQGIWTQAVFVPDGENPEWFVYLLTAAEGLGPREDGWAGFRKEPKWPEFIATSEKDGIVIAKEDYQRLVMTYWLPVQARARNQEAAKESFAALRAAPDWLAAKKASEETAGGSRTVKENGVVSEFLVPAEYSPLR
jgi:hypothetical protein